MSQPSPPQLCQELAAIARHKLKRRRLRERIFENITVSDLVWDILLDLYIAQAEGRLLDVSSLCAYRTVSVSTALRKVWRLQALGIVRRIPAVTDARRDYVALEAFAVARIEKFLATV